MGRHVNMATRDELLRVLRPRYRSATRQEKGRILDEYVALSGCHRKHAIRHQRARELRITDRLR